MSDLPADTLPLDDIRVVDLSTTVPGASATRFLADYGADVIHVEPPGGSGLRQLHGYPYLGRGKRSIVLDLHDAADLDTARALAADADVVVSTWRPGVAERLGLDHAALSAANPGLVSAEISGFGSAGPWRDIKGYEGLVMAKLGLFNSSRRMVERDGPAYVAVPYGNWGAAMGCVQGVLTALIAREDSGIGQRIETNLVQGLDANDCWNWYTHLVGTRYPDAYRNVEMYDDNREPAGYFVYPLLVVPTADGHWLQFAQTQTHLLKAFIEELGLTEMLAEPYWEGFPHFEDRERRVKLWEIMLQRVRQRTLAEWDHVFETNLSVSAEQFRHGRDVLSHPQLVFDGRGETIEDPEYGTVQVPSTLVHADERPYTSGQLIPRLDEHGEQLRATAGTRAAPTALPATDGAAGADRLPLEGVTIVDLAMMFAAPHGTTMLTDLGARVIHVEALEGDQIRYLVEFPEVGGARVMQGKESICVDVRTDEGKAIVQELLRRADAVMCGYRAGAAQRLGMDEVSVRAMNPGVVYLNAPGYGTGGPFGARAAYAPSIGAAASFALASVPDAAEGTREMDLDQVKRAAVRLTSGSASASVT
ncbi:MAG TPA: CoA transferase, partial [Mycobacteriales bacterium]|nr:CoA transferase [Mycobacteriales bacterium]